MAGVGPAEVPVTVFLPGSHCEFMPTIKLVTLSGIIEVGLPSHKLLAASNQAAHPVYYTTSWQAVLRG